MQEKTCRNGHSYNGPRCLECKRAKDREIKARKRAEAKAAAEAPVEAAPQAPVLVEAKTALPPQGTLTFSREAKTAPRVLDLGTGTLTLSREAAKRFHSALGLGEHMTAVRNSGLNRQARRGLASRLRRRKERNPDLIWAAATLAKHCENFRRWIRRVTFTLSPIGAT